MRALVTGAEGFAGRHLLEHLAGAGHEVHATARDAPGDGPAARWLPLDVRDADACGRALSEAEPAWVFHLAGFAHVGQAEQRRDECLAVNFGGTRALLDACRDAAPDARVIVVSSAEVYGPVTPDAVPLTEAAAVRPATTYAVSKAAAELAVHHAVARGLHAVVLRAFNHIGPGQSPDFVSAAFARQLAEIEAGRREPVLRVGNLEAVREFSDVRDTVGAYVLAAERAAAGSVYNVAGGAVVSIRELLDQLLDLTGVRVEVQTDPERMRPVDVPVLSGSDARFHAEVGQVHHRPLRETLADVLAYWRAKVLEAPSR